MKLADKVAIITGGNSGIGKATALLFAREGSYVCITGRNEKRCRGVVEEINKIGGQAFFVIADVRIPDECRKKGISAPEFIGQQPACVKFMRKGLKDRGVVYKETIETIKDRSGYFDIRDSSIAP